MMMKTVKNTFSTIGDRGGDLAGDLASGTADLAKRLGIGTTSFAKRVGPRRGLLGLAVIAAAVGGSVVLIRYLRSRNRNAEVDGSADNAWPGATTKSNYGSHVRPAAATNVPPGTH
jgi:hypothetical protein